VEDFQAGKSQYRSKNTGKIKGVSSAALSPCGCFSTSFTMNNVAIIPRMQPAIHLFTASWERSFFLCSHCMYYAKPEPSQEQIQEDLVLLHRIYPNLNREQLLEAKEHLDRYFDLAVRIFLRLEREEVPDMLDQAKENS